MDFFGPVAPFQTGAQTSIVTTATRTVVKFSYIDSAETTSNNGMQVYAGPRRYPFYFDFNRYNLVSSGTVAPEGFLPPQDASDFFEDLNVLAIVVEVAKFYAWYCAHSCWCSARLFTGRVCARCL